MNGLRARLRGLTALAAIVAIVVALPVVLLAVGPDPFTRGISWDDLARPDDGALALAVVMVIAWVAWAALTATLLVEVVARARGIRAPRLPGLALPQGWAHGLVGAAVALFAAAGPATVASSPAAAEPLAAIEPTPVTASTAPVVVPSVTAGGGRRDQVTEHGSPATVAYTVAPNDSLWSIAEKHLGDGHRYTELVDLNADRLGGRADFLKPGWVLALPATPTVSEPVAAPVTGTRTVTVRPGDTLSEIAVAELGEAARYQEIFDASTGIAQPDGERLSDPDLIQPGWMLVIPGTSDVDDVAVEVRPPAPAPPTASGEPDRGPAPAAETPSAPGTASDADGVGEQGDDGLDSTVPWKVVTGSGIGTVLAAGVIAVVARRRRSQQRRRQPGQRLPMPDGSTADLEQELRSAADELAVQTVDRALRGLAWRCHEDGMPLPGVRAARLTVDRFELFLEEAETLPAPWKDVGNGSIWALDAGMVGDAKTSTAPAPYPALVTIGHDDEAGHILLNLERVGALGITGSVEDTRAIVAALTLELATSVWADDLEVTVVGWFAEVEGVLRSGRIRWVPTLDRLLDELAERAAADRQAITAAGVRDLGAARAAGLLPDAWTPQIVVVADFMTDTQKTRLAALIAQTPRVAVAAVTSGVSVGQWGIRTTTGRVHAVLDPIAMPLTPQRLALEQYDDLLQLVDLADPTELVGDGEPGPAHDQVQGASPHPHDGSDPGTGVHDHRDVRSIAPVPTAPRLLVLGPVDLLAATGTVEDSKKARLLELAAYLALHPNASATAIDEAIWPERTHEDNLNTRNTATSKLRRWVGQDEAGQDFLPRHAAGGGYGFTAAVTSDVGDWDALMGGEPRNATTEDLEAALALVRGAPFHGTHHRRYAWSEHIRQRLVSEIVDASCTLAERRLTEGRWRAAEAAVVVGLLLDPAQEALWRLRILIAHAERNPAAVAEAVDRLLAITEELEVELEPETEQLLADLKSPRAPGATRLRAL